MDNYYSKNLSAERLKLCYDIASPRIKQYLDSEISFVLDKINPTDEVLELGCGYGRVLLELTKKARLVVGIDNSYDNIQMAKELFKDIENCQVYEMDAGKLDFSDDSFDKVLCIQNGLSAFKLDKLELIKEALRVTRKGGSAFFSSYSNKFWKDRLKWFQTQVEHGLLGKIDNDKTKDGTIVCKDGFKATTISSNEFTELIKELNVMAKITEVDKSSIFCEIIK